MSHKVLQQMLLLWADFEKGFSSEVLGKMF